MTRGAKAAVRKAAAAARAALADRPQRSLQIARRAARIPAFAAARTVAVYVGVRNEVLTDALIDVARALRKTIAVPYCDGAELRLIRLDRLDELAPGAFGIPEPLAELRGDVERIVRPETVNAFIVPGVAFDHRGHRLGHGRGYYDRLLACAAANATLIGLAYQCQMAESIPADPHDVAMHFVVTEEQTISTVAPAEQHPA